MKQQLEQVLDTYRRNAIDWNHTALQTDRQIEAADDPLDRLGLRVHADKARSIAQAWTRAADLLEATINRK